MVLNVVGSSPTRHPRQKGSILLPFFVGASGAYIYLSPNPLSVGTGACVSLVGTSVSEIVAAKRRKQSPYTQSITVINPAQSPLIFEIEPSTFHNKLTFSYLRQSARLNDSRLKQGRVQRRH